MQNFNPTPAPTLEDRVAALEAQVAELKAQAAGGWPGLVSGFWRKYETYLTPLLVAAVGAAVLWLQNLNHKDTQSKVQEATDKVVAVETATKVNAEKIDAAKAEAATAAVKADSAAANAAMAAQKADENHADLKAEVKDVKDEVKKPRPLFPPGKKDGE